MAEAARLGARPRRRGIALGLALLTKTTWITPVRTSVRALWLAWPASLGVGEECHVGPGAVQGLQLGAALLLGLYVLNMGYAFEGTCERLGGYWFVSETLGGPPERRTRAVRRNGFAGTWLDAVPVPVPRNYLLGIDVQKHDFEVHYYSYLRGEWRKEGWCTTTCTAWG